MRLTRYFVRNRSGLVSVLHSLFRSLWIMYRTTLLTMDPPARMRSARSRAGCSATRSRSISATAGAGNWMLGEDSPAMTALPGNTDLARVLPETWRGASRDKGINKGTGPCRSFYYFTPGSGTRARLSALTGHRDATPRLLAHDLPAPHRSAPGTDVRPAQAD